MFRKLSISKIQCSSFEIWDCQWLKTLNVTPGFTALILFLLFQFIKICLCCFTFTHFFFFLTATNVLASTWITFSNTRITTVFFLFLILFSLGSLMEINSTHVCFSGWMLWKTDDEKQKDKNTFKDNSQSGYFIY